MPIFDSYLNKEEKYLYHYTSLEVAIEHILPEGRLRFNPFIRTNDPREVKNWAISSSVSEDGMKLLELGFDKLQEDFHDYFKKDIKVISLTLDEERCYVPYMNPYFNGRGFSHPRMWAQYASGHRGVCLIFDHDKLQESIKEGFSNHEMLFQGKVEYNRHPREFEAFKIDYDKVLRDGIDKTFNEHLKKYFRILYLTKATDWKDEIEYRWLVKSSKEYEYVSIYNCIKAIIIGDETPVIYENMFKNFKEKYDIHLARMNWHNGNPNPFPVL